MDPATLRQAARELLVEIRVESERATINEACGWVVVCRDEENGHLHITGTYTSPEEALTDAARQHADVNRDLPEGEPSWTHTVWPLFPPSS